MLLQEVIGVASYGFREIEDAGYFVESFGEGKSSIDDICFASRVIANLCLEA